MAGFFSTFFADRAPGGHGIRKTDPFKSSFRQHLLDLASRKPLLEPSTKPIVGIGAHHVEFSIAVGLKWNGKRRKAGPLDNRCQSRQGPIYHDRNDLADDQPRGWRQR